MVEPLKITLGDGSLVVCISLKEAFQKLKEMKESNPLEPPSDVVKARRASAAAIDGDGNKLR